ncbi:putative quinol monooxygenase [uncultured Deinococcus sp.]|uniref:putative quinol monooxygenase n=1 Tax=uncultured Deinococcus sp. TaxID=158789 RepID=UPI0025D1D316|nr:putative quinol monooxygenase [uncultured Deinococcus sp.]
MSADPQAVTVHAIITPRPEHVAEVEAELRIMVRETRQEPGNRRYDLLREQTPDGMVRFHVQERYRDLDAVQAHRDSPHYQAYRAKAATWFLEAPQVTLLSDVEVGG